MYQCYCAYEHHCAILQTHSLWPVITVSHCRVSMSVVALVLACVLSAALANVAPLDGSNFDQVCIIFCRAMHPIMLYL